MKECCLRTDNGSWYRPPDVVEDGFAVDDGALVVWRRRRLATDSDMVTAGISLITLISNGDNEWLPEWNGFLECEPRSSGGRVPYVSIANQCGTSNANQLRSH